MDNVEVPPRDKKVYSCELVYISQIIIVFVVILACIVNLTLENEPHNLWITLLSSSLGYILPAPTLPKRKYINNSESR